MNNVYNINLLDAQKDILNLRNQNEELRKILSNIKSPICNNQVSADLHPQNLDNILSNTLNSKLILQQGYFIDKAGQSVYQIINFLQRFRELNQTLTKKYSDSLNINTSSKYVLNNFNQITLFLKDSINDIQSHLSIIKDYSDVNLKDKLNSLVSQSVQEKIYTFQNPPNCNIARKLICDLDKACGFGCQIHHIIYCSIVAFSSKRMLLINSKHWSYDKSGFEHLFLPLSNSCSSHKLVDVIHDWKGDEHAKGEEPIAIALPIVDILRPKSQYLPLTMPAEIDPLVRLFHGKPHIWWISQFASYILRPNEQLKQTIKETTKKLNFQNPIVGLHVRRTDKIGTEAAFHHISEYMRWADHYFDILDLKNAYSDFANKTLFSNPTEHYLKMPTKIKRAVYIATDDNLVVEEAIRMYPHYNVIGNQDAVKFANTNDRYSLNGLIGIYLDIYFLAQCDYLVCTFSSQVCRLAYELMNGIKHRDLASNYYSLDDTYYYGGGEGLKYTAIRDYIPPKDLYSDAPLNSFQGHPNRKYRDDIAVYAGQTVGILGDEHNGYSLIRYGLSEDKSRNKFKRGNKFETLIPSAILEAIPLLANFPRILNETLS